MGWGFWREVEERVSEISERVGKRRVAVDATMGGRVGVVEFRKTV